MHNFNPEQFDMTSIIIDLHHTEIEDDFETSDDIYNFTLGE